MSNIYIEIEIELLNNINFSDIIDSNLTSHTGKSPESSYGTTF